MEDMLNINITIYPKEKIFFIAEECSSGASYEFNNTNELAENIQLYLENYYKEAIEGTKEELDK